jgi:hypothetical protein
MLVSSAIAEGYQAAIVRRLMPSYTTPQTSAHLARITAAAHPAAISPVCRQKEGAD